MLSVIQNIDWSVLNFIQDTFKCGFFDYIMPKISMLGDLGAIWLIAAVVLLFSKKYRMCGIMIIIGIAIGFLIGNLCLKPIVARPRPCWLDSTVQMLVPIEMDFSFPSGHTLASVIAAVILTMANRKFGYIAIPLATLIAFSRLYLYLHFLTDVLFSMFLGTLIAVFVFWTINKFYPVVLK